MRNIYPRPLLWKRVCSRTYGRTKQGYKDTVDNKTGTEVDQTLIDKEEQELWNEAIMEDDTDDWGSDIYLG